MNRGLRRYCIAEMMGGSKDGTQEVMEYPPPAVYYYPAPAPPQSIAQLTWVSAHPPDIFEHVERYVLDPSIECEYVTVGVLGAGTGKELKEIVWCLLQHRRPARYHQEDR